LVRALAKGQKVSNVLGLPQKQGLGPENTGQNSTKIEALKYCQHFRAFKRAKTKKYNRGKWGKIRRSAFGRRAADPGQSFYIGDLERKLCKFKCWPLPLLPVFEQ